MPSFVILNRKDRVIHSFDAAGPVEARITLRDWVLRDRAEYTLARKIVTATSRVVMSPGTVDETDIP